MPYYVHFKNQPATTGTAFPDRASAYTALHSGELRESDDAIMDRALRLLVENGDPLTILDRVSMHAYEYVQKRAYGQMGDFYATYGDHYYPVVVVLDEARARVKRSALDSIDRAVYTPQTAIITFHANDGERARWRDREYCRFRNGEYARVPWADDDRYSDHFVHISTVDPGFVAYTKDEEHGVQDRQTRVRPGKYLEQFYADVPKATRDEWIARVQSERYELKIARTREEIARVYRGGNAYTHSCMTDERIMDLDSGHPCEVYAGPDLAVAYMGDIDEVRARSVIWPDRMIYVRIYGSPVMRALLEAAGYSHDSIEGARILAIPSGDGYLMPYIDGIQSASLSRNGRYFVLDNSGEYETDNTRGETEDSRSAVCEGCSERYDPDDEYAHGGYCPSCNDDRSSCDGCSEDFWSSDLHSTHYGGNYCDHCYREAQRPCANCGDDYHPEDISRQDHRDRIARDMDDCCESCGNDYDHCADCGEYIDRDSNCECQNGDHEPRERGDVNDDRTIELPTDAPTPVPSKPLMWIWWTKQRNISPEETRTYWVWDGTRGWHTSAASGWILSSSRFTPAGMDAVQEYYARCADPRPTNQPIPDACEVSANV